MDNSENGARNGGQRREWGRERQTRMVMARTINKGENVARMWQECGRNNE